MLDPKFLKQVFGVDAVQAKKRWDLLTNRQREVAEKLGRGASNAEVAEQLQISPKTLDIHRSVVKRKLDVKTTAGIAMHYFAVQVSDRLAK